MMNQLVLRFIGTSSLSYSYRHSTAANKTVSSVIAEAFSSFARSEALGADDAYCPAYDGYTTRCRYPI